MNNNELKAWLKDNKKKILTFYPLIFVAALFIAPPLAALLLLPICLFFLLLMIAPLLTLISDLGNIFCRRDRYSSIDSHDRLGPDDGDAGD
jgi:uncharacterized membrane protein